MKIRSNKREGNRIILEVEEEYSKFLEAADHAIKEAGREVNIPGFRPGKAPKEMVEKVLNREYIEAQAAQRLISRLYPDVIDEASIEPVDYPAVDILEQKKGDSIVFKIEVDVYPEVKLGKYKGLKVDKKAVKVTEEDVDKVLENMRKRLSAMEGGEGKELPALDDEFARKISRYQTLGELRKELLEGMQKDKESEAEAEVKNQLIGAASAEAAVEIPKGMVEREIGVMLDELRNSLAQSGLTLDEYLKGIKKDEKSMRDELRKSAEVRVTGKVVLKAIAEVEGIKVTDEEMKEELRALSAAAGQSEAEAEKGIDEHARKYIEDYLLRRKALEFILEKAKVKIEEVKEEKKND